MQVALLHSLTQGDVNFCRLRNMQSDTYMLLYLTQIDVTS